MSWPLRQRQTHRHPEGASATEGSRAYEPAHGKPEILRCAQDDVGLLALVGHWPLLIGPRSLPNPQAPPPPRPINPPWRSRHCTRRRRGCGPCPPASTSSPTTSPTPRPPPSSAAGSTSKT